MPMPPVLTDIAKTRVEVISFFLMLLLCAAGGIRLVWNHLRQSFPRLPHLSYGKALSLILLWGLLFLIVLEMIAGARELMTPGAWDHDGATYKLAGSPPK
jgi:hypothetical protein